MRRDWEIVRRILIDTADATSGVYANVWVTDTVPLSVVGYHVAIMQEGGLLNATIQGADNSPYYVCRVNGLTWEGQDFLAAIKPQSVWGRAKHELSLIGGDAAKDTVKALAVKAGAHLLGL